MLHGPSYYLIIKKNMKQRKSRMPKTCLISCTQSISTLRLVKNPRVQSDETTECLCVAQSLFVGL